MKKLFLLALGIACSLLLGCASTEEGTYMNMDSTKPKVIYIERDPFFSPYGYPYLYSYPYSMPFYYYHYRPYRPYYYPHQFPQRPPRGKH